VLELSEGIRFSLGLRAAAKILVEVAR